MEISSKELREVEFRERLRGYDTTEVDEFLERVAVAVDDLKVSLRQQSERAERAERAATQPRDRGSLDDEEALRRTLVLAQRTADMAIREAQEEAAELLERARAECDSLVSGARETAKRISGDAQRQLQEELDRLTGLRDQLRTDVRTLSDLLDNERERLTEALGSALKWVDQSLTPSPELTSHRAAPLSSEGQDAGDGVESQVEEDADAASHQPSASGDDKGRSESPDEPADESLDDLLDEPSKPSGRREARTESSSKDRDTEAGKPPRGPRTEDADDFLDTMPSGGLHSRPDPDVARVTGLSSVRRFDSGPDTEMWEPTEISPHSDWSA